MLEAAGQREQALAAYRESLAIGEKLAADPGNAEWQRDLSISLERIGAVALKTGKRAEAVEALRRALASASSTPTSAAGSR